MSLKIELHRTDLTPADEILTDEEFAKRLTKKIATTIAHYAEYGWCLQETRELDDGVILHFHHPLPAMW